MYFYKLKNKFKIDDFSVKDETAYYGIKFGNKVLGLRYCNVDSIEKDKLLSVLPERYQSSPVFLSMESNCYIAPHTDSKIQATINFYIRPDNCETSFYSFKNKTEGFKQSNQTNGATYKLKDLYLESSFIADEGDVYLLDVSKPHSVKPLNKIANRFSLCLQFIDYNFKEVYNMLKEMDR